MGPMIFIRACLVNARFVSGHSRRFDFANLMPARHDVAVRIIRLCQKGFAGQRRRSSFGAFLSVVSRRRAKAEV
jgi:hypothetical protein